MVKYVVEAAETAATSRTSRKDCCGLAVRVTLSPLSYSSVALDHDDVDGVLNELLAVAELLMG